MVTVFQNVNANNNDGDRADGVEDHDDDSGFDDDDDDGDGDGDADDDDDDDAHGDGFAVDGVGRENEFGDKSLISNGGSRVCNFYAGDHCGFNGMF